MSAAHPRAVEAGVATLRAGGSAVDAMISAQAVLCVIAPEACGLGGDGLALVATSDGAVAAVNGTGRWPANADPGASCADSGPSVTVPGLVDSWTTASARFGKLPLRTCLLQAISLAEDGAPISDATVAAADQQRRRLVAGGAGDWVMATAQPGEIVKQPELAATLRSIATDGATAFATGPSAHAIANAVQRHDGALDLDDLADHETLLTATVSTAFDGGQLHVQPPPTQGVLLAMAAEWLDNAAERQAVDHSAIWLDHIGVELTEAVFQFRSRAAEGTSLLGQTLEVDPVRAARRGGPRPYLHTAGVAVADDAGQVVSSLVSVFDDFGSGVFVPELGIVLNNRAGGFTDGPNRPRPGQRPVHTLAPSLWSGPGETVALATPGADGQVQTLLQVVCRWRLLGEELDRAIAAPRWRSQGDALLLEDDHPNRGPLTDRGHATVARPRGDGVFGAVVAAAYDRADGTTRAWNDWRRDVSAGRA